MQVMAEQALWEASAWQANSHWKVLVLLEFNHLLVRCTLDALAESGWGDSIELTGYRMHIRPGAIEFLDTFLQETSRTCNLAIFTGLSPDIVVEMVIVLFRMFDLTWNVEQGDWLAPSVAIVNGRGIRVYIIERSVKEELDNEKGSSRDICMPPELSRRRLYLDFGKAWQALNCMDDNNFHKQNTMLIGFKEDKSLCPDNVLSMRRWERWDTREHMDYMCTCIEHFFRQKPFDVRIWLQTIRNVASI